MPDLSIKNTPADVVERLKARAQRNHRSLQGELRAIVETASREPVAEPLDAVLAELKELGLRTPSESVAMIRADRERDGR